MLNSQNVRRAGPETDPLWIGTGKTVKDLAKAQILIESTEIGRASCRERVSSPV